MEITQFRKSLEDGFKAQSKRLEESFRGLTPEQLNWRPDEKTWSVGQCLHHIWITNDKYLAVLAGLVREARHKQKPEQDYSSSWMGTRFIEMVGPTGGQNTPVPKVLTPPHGRTPADIVQRLLDQLEGFQEFILESRNIDLRKTKMASPIAKVIRLPLGDVFLALQGHNERHMNQAARLMRLAGFGAS